MASQKSVIACGTPKATLAKSKERLFFTKIVAKSTIRRFFITKTGTGTSEDGFGSNLLTRLVNGPFWFRSGPKPALGQVYCRVIFGLDHVSILFFLLGL